MVKIWIQKIAEIQIHICSLNKGGKRLNHSQAMPKQLIYYMYNVLQYPSKKLNMYNMSYLYPNQLKIKIDNEQ